GAATGTGSCPGSRGRWRPARAAPRTAGPAARRCRPRPRRSSRYPPRGGGPPFGPARPPPPGGPGPVAARPQFPPRTPPGSSVQRSITTITRWEFPMSTSTKPNTAAPAPNHRTLDRILDEGDGPRSRPGHDLKAALADVRAEAASWRPAPGRHNIAEIALHHAWCVRGVRGQLSAAPLEPFLLEGEDWFDLP